tara:strand:- start:25989 stop:26558 length:570 start_codon:yes stop_codon:yes gene_type:complete
LSPIVDLEAPFSYTEVAVYYLLHYNWNISSFKIVELLFRTLVGEDQYVTTTADVCVRFKDLLGSAHSFDMRLCDFYYLVDHPQITVPDMSPYLEKFMEHQCAHYFNQGVLYTLCNRAKLTPTEINYVFGVYKLQRTTTRTSTRTTNHTTNHTQQKIDYNTLPTTIREKINSINIELFAAVIDSGESGES